MSGENPREKERRRKTDWKNWKGKREDMKG